MGHLRCPPAVSRGFRAREQGVLERELHPQNWSLSAILAMCLGTRTHLLGAAQSITAKARAPRDEQPKEEPLCGRSACKCRAEPLQQHVTRRAGPLHVHPTVPVPSTAHHVTALPSLCAGSLPVISPSSRACTHSSNTEKSWRCSTELGCARKPL